MKKFNWGWGITLLYSGFVVFMVTLALKTTTIKDDLVTPDYYAKELQYQERLDRMKNSHDLKEQPTWQVSGNAVAIKFPQEQVAKNVKAEILFYNTAQAKKDVKITCMPDSTGLCAINPGQLQNGVYKMQIDWNAGGVDYYNEGTINIQ